MIFFIDRDLGSIFPEILSAANIQVEKHNEHFKPDSVPDETWLSAVGHNKWFAISRDQRIRYKPNQKLAVIQGNVGLFIVIGKNASHRELAENFVASYHKIEKFIKEHTTPFIAKVYMPSANKSQDGNKAGHVEMWYSP